MNKMKKLFTSEFMQSNRGCYNKEQMESTVLIGKKEITLDEFLETNIPLKDKYWFVCKKLATKEQNQEIAIGVAEIVLDIYETKYPDNKAPRKAIKAAKNYLNNTGIALEELRQKRSAAYAAASAAYAAASAASAASAAADSAYAAAYAASDAAAASAAYAAAYAAYAAADYDVNYKDLMLTFLKEFCKKKQ